MGKRTLTEGYCNDSLKHTDLCSLRIQTLCSSAEKQLLRKRRYICPDVYLQRLRHKCSQAGEGGVVSEFNSRFIFWLPSLPLWPLPPRGTTAARRHHRRQSWMYFREVGRDSSGPVLCEIPCARFQIVPRVGVCLFIIQTTPRVRIIDNDNEKKTLNLPKQMLSCPNPVVCFIIFTDTSIPICISISLSFFSFHLFFSVMFLDK